ncbi:MAG TPA: PDZ domain-containing protein, partial [Anaerolineales bacterium]|nr:PDZ domain-containing protein [Anaerolineales bacterium]
GSPADNAGLRGGDTPIPDSTYFSGGDLITAIDDQHVQDFSDLISYLLNNTSPGDTVVLTILRDGEPMQINLILGKRP